MLSVRHHLLYWAVSAAAAAAYASLAAVPLGQWHDAFFPAVIAALYLYRHVVRDWKWRFLRGSPGRTWYAAATFATLSSLGTAASLVAMLEPLADSGSSWRAVSAVHTLAALTALSVCEARRQRRSDIILLASLAGTRRLRRRRCSVVVDILLLALAHCLFWPVLVAVLVVFDYGLRLYCGLGVVDLAAAIWNRLEATAPGSSAPVFAVLLFPFLHIAETLLSAPYA